MHRLPANTPTTLEDFRTSDWKTAAGGFADRSYVSMWDSLRQAAAAATDAGALPKARVLWLLADACSLRLDPDKTNEPLLATFVGSEHSVGLTDFDNGELEFLGQISPALDDALLRARVADILWLRRRPRRIQDAIEAIDAYRSTSLAGDAWFLHNSQACWRRALMLATQIRSPGESRVADMKAALFAAVKTHLDAGTAAPSMVETMLDYGLAQDHLDDLAERLVERAHRLSATEEGSRFFATRHYLSLAKRCLGLERNDERCADIDCAISDSFAAEATARISGEHKSYLVAASFYAHAVHALLAMPKRLRVARGIDEKLRALRQTQRELAMQSMGDFAPMRGEPVDLTEEVRSTQEEVSGKDLSDALRALAECWPLASRRLAEEHTRKMMEQLFFSRLFSSQKLASDGRVVANGPAAGDRLGSSDQSQQAVWNKMVQDHTFHVRYGVQSSIAPAFRQFVLEHLITIDDLVNIVALSGMILAERVGLVAKGLKAGFEGDFIVALHILVPQLEHLVRTHLQLKGAKTVTTDGDGLQMEAGLSTLVGLPEMESVFGEDLAFEIRALFCDGFGPNLRNELAHGLLDVDALQSAESIYAWWLLFRTIYQQYWYRNEH